MTREHDARYAKFIRDGNLAVDIDINVATIVINRPHKRNSLTLSMWRGLSGLFTALGQDANMRAIILTGAGTSFSSGADISEFAEVRSTREQAREYEMAVEACCEAIATTPRPTVAAITGFCMGGGCNLAMSCDFRFANAAAMFGIPAARLSIVYGVDGTRRLLALVGLSNAKRILYSAQRFDANEALRIGFADQLDDDPVAKAREFCSVLADNAPLTIAGTKTLLNGLAMGRGALEDATARDVIERAALSDDYREGRAAFMAKRKPVFLGR